MIQPLGDDISKLYSEPMEKAVLGCCLYQPAESWPKAHVLTESDFFVPAHKLVWRAIAALQREQEAVEFVTIFEWLKNHGHEADMGGVGFLAELANAYASPAALTTYMKVVQEKTALRSLHEVNQSLARAIQDNPEDLDGVLKRAQQGLTQVSESRLGSDACRPLLESRRFDMARPPEKTEPVLWIGDVGIAKAGDLVAVSAQVKSGKSAIIGAMMASLMGTDGDFLGFDGKNPHAWPVLHLDTEQSPEDHHDLIMRSLRRAGAPVPPTWLRSYCLTDLSVAQRKEALAYELKRLQAQFGGICAVILDGGADLCMDVNDTKEAFALVDQLYGLAIQYHCPLVCVLHENPGSEVGKTRGHFGSHLERKAATNLRLAKNGDGVIQVFTEKARRGFIAKDTGPHFIWDDQQGMHLSCETGRVRKAQVRDKEKLQRLWEAAGDVLHEKGGVRHAELVGLLIKRLGCSERTAKTRIEDMRNAGILTYTEGLHLYSLNREFKL